MRLRQLYDRKNATSQSARSLRSIRTKSNASLLRSCLMMTRSAHASQVQIVAHAASQSSQLDSPQLTQRRCQSLGRFPGDADTDPHRHRSIQPQDETTGQSIASERPLQQQFLCVPQAYPTGGNKSYHRRRRESKSLDLIPSELRLTLMERSSRLPSCSASQEDTEDEHSRLLDDHNVVLTIPNGNRSEQQAAQLSDCLSKPNGHIKLIHNDDEGIDVNPETQQQRTSLLSASGQHLEPEKRWHSCDQLQRTAKDTAIASTVNKSVKQWLVSLFGVGQASDPFVVRNPPNSGEEFPDIHRDERESVV